MAVFVERFSSNLVRVRARVRISSNLRIIPRRVGVRVSQGSGSG